MSEEYSPKKQLETERGGSGRKGKTAIGSSDGGDADDFQRWPGGQGDPRQRKRLRVVICEPNELIRKGLAAMLRPFEDVVGETDDGSVAVELVRELQPDVLLLSPDSLVLNGTQVCTAISEAVSKTKVLICTDVYTATKCYHKLMRAGANGIYMKASGKYELRQAIINVVRGDKYCDPYVSRLVNQNIREAITSDKLPNLNRLQTDILVRLDLCNREIAEELDLKLRDVEEHLQYIFTELQVLTRMAAAQKAVKLGFVLLPRMPLVDPTTGLSAEQSTAEQHARDAIY